MTALVFDADVGIKWFVPEASAAAAQMRAGRFDPHAPELFLAETAPAIALGTGRTVHDGMCLALADRLRVRLVTADERLTGGLRGTRWQATVCGRDDLPNPTNGKPPT